MSFRVFDHYYHIIDILSNIFLNIRIYVKQPKNQDGSNA